MVNTNSVLSSILFSQTIDWNIKQFFSSTSINSSFELKRIGKAITRRKDQMVVEDDKRYKRITIKTNCGGVFVRDEVLGKDIKTKKQYYVKAGQLAVSKIDARNGAFGIVPPEADGAIITGNFWVYDVNPEIANIDYLILLLSSNVFVQAWQDCSNGSGNRLYLQEEKFLNYKIPMPEADVQKDLIRKYNTQLAEAKKDQDSIDNLQYQIEQYILKKLGISFKRSSFNGLIGTTYYKNLTRWDPTYLSNKIIINSNEKMIDMAAVIIFAEQFGVIAVHLPKYILGQFFGKLCHIMIAIPSSWCGIELGVNGSLLKVRPNILFLNFIAPSFLARSLAGHLAAFE